jgi:hypothetical protein
MVLNSGSRSGILDRKHISRVPRTFQSSLRDFSSLESPPRTTSWAKFSRPTGLAIVRISRTLFSLRGTLFSHSLSLNRMEMAARSPTSAAKTVPFVRIASSTSHEKSRSWQANSGESDGYSGELIRGKVKHTHEVIEGRGIGRYIGVILSGNRVGEVVPAARGDCGKSPVCFDELQDRNMVRIVMNYAAALGVGRDNNQGDTRPVAKESTG